MIIAGTILAQPPSGAPTAVPMQLVGIPAIERVAFGSYPSTATLAPDQLSITLSYPDGNIVAGESFRVGPYDPAIRTATGGFACPGVIAPAQDDAPVLVFTAAAQLDGSVLLTIPNVPGAQSLVYDPYNFYSDALASKNFQISSTPYLSVLWSGGPVVAGDTVTYGGPIIRGNGSSVATLSRAPVTVT